MQETDAIPDQLERLLNGKTQSEIANLTFRIRNEHVEIWNSYDPIYQAFLNQKINWGPESANWYGTTYNTDTFICGMLLIGVLYNEDGRRYDICRLK